MQFEIAHKAYLQAKAAYDGAPEGTPDGQDRDLESAYQRAYVAVCDSEVRSLADAASAIKFARTHAGDSSIPQILANTIDFLSIVICG